MPRNSLQRKSSSQSSKQEIKMIPQSKRKRRSLGTRDAENISPPVKKFHTQVDDDDRVPQQQTSPFKNVEPATWSDRPGMTCFLTPSTSHSDASNIKVLPSFPWADSKSVWTILCNSDEKTSSQRSPDMFQRHRNLQPHMRAILLDWLIEVCDVYKLHRETYYLAMDFIDRYLSTHENIPKGQLQLIGITCLFIAAKVEEIYPPKVGEFAYVTDGACTEQDILSNELVLLHGLNWKLSSVTIPGWLNVFMQIERGDWSRPNAFIYPQYGGLQYSQAAQILDLATMDENSLKYSYRLLAAGAVKHILGAECAMRVSNYDWDQLMPCVDFLASFARTVREDGQHQLLHSSITSNECSTGSGLKATVPNITTDEMHRLQTHVVDLKMLEKAQRRLAESVDHGTYFDGGRSSPNQSSFLTPPSSNQKNSPPTPHY